MNKAIRIIYYAFKKESPTSIVFNKEFILINLNTGGYIRLDIKEDKLSLYHMRRNGGILYLPKSLSLFSALEIG